MSAQLATQSFFSPLPNLIDWTSSSSLDLIMVWEIPQFKLPVDGGHKRC